MRHVPKTSVANMPAPFVPLAVTAELASWLACTRCQLHTTRRNVVLGRGSLPADVCFIGIGPGKSEDLIGAAFVGPSGRLLNIAIHRAGGSRLRLCFTNLVACHPTDRLRGPNRDPTAVEIVTCRPRLALTLALASPKRIVALGDLARIETRALYSDAIPLHHPSFILRAGGTSSLEFRRFVRELEDVFTGV